MSITIFFLVSSLSLSNNHWTGHENDRLQHQFFCFFSRATSPGKIWYFNPFDRRSSSPSFALLHSWWIFGNILLFIYIYNIQYLKTSWTSEKKNRWKKNTSQQACTENPRSKENPPNHGSPKNQSTVTATEPACPSTGRRKSAGPNLKWVLNPKIGGCFPQNGWWK